MEESVLLYAPIRGEFFPFRGKEVEDEVEVG